MTDQQIQAGNKLIADAIGVLQFTHPNGIQGNVWDFRINLPEKLEANGYYPKFRLDDMRFHENWEWLMFAIDKLPELYSQTLIPFDPYCIGNIDIRIRVNLLPQVTMISYANKVTFHTTTTDDTVLDLWNCLVLHLEYINKNRPEVDNG